MSGFATVFILLQLVIPFVPNIACSSVPKFSIINNKIDTVNASNKTNGCDPQFSESALQVILELMRDKITHVIDLHIWTESVNNTGNKVQVLTGIKWANEIGRTLISLIAEAKKSDKFMFLSHTSTMTAGTYSINIFVAEEVMECFSSSKNTTDHAIFDLLVQKLYHITGNKTDYKLCLPHNDNDHVAKYNCCTIVGSNDALICSDYSSVVTEMSSILVLLTVLLILYVLFPVTLECFSQFKENDTHYKISNSTMSFSYFLFLIFLKGHGPIKTLGRKLILALFVLVTTLPIYGSLLFQCYMIFMGPWLAVLFIGNISFDKKFLFRSFQNPVEIITIPFNIKMCWCKAKQFPSTIKGCLSRFQEYVQPCCSCLFSCTSKSESNINLIKRTEREENVEDTSQPLSREEENKRENHKKLSFIKRTRKRFLVLVFFIFYLISIPFLSLYAFARLILHNWKFVKKQVRSNLDEDACMPRYNANRISLTLFIIVTCGFIVFSIHNLFPLALNFIIGLFLNGEIYSPYILPLCTTTVYSWTKWRSSVEMKYLALIMNIYKVCKESSVESDECSDNVTEDFNMASEVEKLSTTDTSRKRFTITTNDDGEAIIPKELYHLVREKLLPYDRILFDYFQGVLFTAIFGYLLYILMSLAQTSGISGSVQVIGTIAAASLPFIFNFVWRKNSNEQKKVDTIALKLKLNHILLVRNRNDKTREIDVEVRNIENAADTEDTEYTTDTKGNKNTCTCCKR